MAGRLAAAVVLLLLGTALYCRAQAELPIDPEGSQLANMLNDVDGDDDDDDETNSISRPDPSMDGSGFAGMDEASGPLPEPKDSRPDPSMDGSGFAGMDEASGPLPEPNDDNKAVAQPDPADWSGGAGWDERGSLPQEEDDGLSFGEQRDDSMDDSMVDSWDRANPADDFNYGSSSPSMGEDASGEAATEGVDHMAKKVKSSDGKAHFESKPYKKVKQSTGNDNINARAAEEDALHANDSDDDDADLAAAEKDAESAGKEGVDAAVGDIVKSMGLEGLAGYGEKKATDYVSSNEYSQPLPQPDHAPTPTEKKLAAKKEYDDQVQRLKDNPRYSAEDLNQAIAPPKKYNYKKEHHHKSSHGVVKAKVVSNLKADKKEPPAPMKPAEIVNKKKTENSGGFHDVKTVSKDEFAAKEQGKTKTDDGKAGNEPSEGSAEPTVAAAAAGASATAASAGAILPGSAMAPGDKKFVQSHAVIRKSIKAETHNEVVAKAESALKKAAAAGGGIPTTAPWYAQLHDDHKVSERKAATAKHNKAPSIVIEKDNSRWHAASTSSGKPASTSGEALLAVTAGGNEAAVDAVNVAVPSANPNSADAADPRNAAAHSDADAVREEDKMVSDASSIVHDHDKDHVAVQPPVAKGGEDTQPKHPKNMQSHDNVDFLNMESSASRAIEHINRARTKCMPEALSPLKNYRLVSDNQGDLRLEAYGSHIRIAYSRHSDGSSFKVKSVHPSPCMISMPNDLGSKRAEHIKSKDVRRAADMALKLINQKRLACHFLDEDTDKVLSKDVMRIEAAEEQVVRGLVYELVLSFNFGSKAKADPSLDAKSAEVKSPVKRIRVVVELTPGAGHSPDKLESYQLKETVPDACQLNPMSLAHNKVPLQSDAKMDEINNDKNVQWKAAKYDRFEGMSLEEGQVMAGGVLEATRSYTTTNPYEVLRYSESYSAPESFDMRTEYPKCPLTVRDQGECGSCGSWTATGVLADRFCVATGGALKGLYLSPHDVMTCDSENGGCCGSVQASNWEHLKNAGAMEARCKPYFARSSSSGMCNTNGDTCTSAPASDCERFRANGWYVAGRAATPSASWDEIERTVMHAIATGGSVDGSLKTYADFYGYSSGVYVVSDQYKGEENNNGHAIKIVGWGEDNGVKYWLCQNTWSTGWGESGFFRIRRGTDESSIEQYFYWGDPLRSCSHAGDCTSLDNGYCKHAENSETGSCGCFDNFSGVSCNSTNSLKIMSSTTKYSHPTLNEDGYSLTDENSASGLVASLVTVCLVAFSVFLF